MSRKDEMMSQEDLDAMLPPFDKICRSTLPPREDCLREFHASLAGLQEMISEVEECYDFGQDPPGAIMAKIAFMMRNMAANARAYAEQTPL